MIVVDITSPIVLGVDSSVTNNYIPTVVPGGQLMSSWVSGNQSTKLCVIDNKLYAAGKLDTYYAYLHPKFIVHSNQ